MDLKTFGVAGSLGMLACAAQAQGSVTLYGTVDQYLSRLSSSSGAHVSVSRVPIASSHRKDGAVSMRASCAGVDSRSRRAVEDACAPHAVTNAARAQTAMCATGRIDRADDRANAAGDHVAGVTAFPTRACEPTARRSSQLAQEIVGLDSQRLE